MGAEDRLIWKIFSPFWRMALVSVLLAAAAIACGIGLISTSAYLISEAALHPSIAELEVAIVGVRFFGLMRGVFVYLERLYSHSVNFKLVGGLRTWFYQKLEPLAPAGLMGDRSGDLLARAVSDIETLESVYVRIIAPPLATLVILVGMQVFLGRFNPVFSLILTVFYLLGGVLLPLALMNLMQPVARAAALERAQFHADAVDALQGSADLIAYGQTERMLGRLDRDDAQYTKAVYNHSVLSGGSTAVLTLLSGLAAAAMLAVGASLVEQGALNGVYLAVIALGTTASFEALNPLPLAAQTLMNARESAGRLLEIVQREPAVRDPVEPAPLPGRWDLELHDVSFCYPGSSDQALRHLDLRLPEGKHVAVVGPSGAGKSTLANLLLRVWEISDGEIRLNGRDLRDYRSGDLRRQTGYVSAGVFIFNDTLRNNLLIADPSAADRQLIEACRLAQLTPLLDSRKDGLDTRLGERGLQISGGEKIRLAAARCILQNPRMIILDEPTANLDVETERDLLNTYFDLFSEKTILWITHRLVMMNRVDEIVVLNHGEKVESGSHAGLLQQSGLYARLLGIQQKWMEDRSTGSSTG
jgi:ATP-binding cassette subfamily C protein CydC